MSGRRGMFITVEGGEGVGKSTNIEFIGRWLSERNIRYVSTREPGGTPLAEEIRAMLLEPREEKIQNLAELLLVFAARAQHLQNVIEPALASGQWVLCDRFTDATYAYQGGGRLMDLDSIALLEQLVQQGLHPDLTLLLDIDPAQGLARAAQRSELDRFERESGGFFLRVREHYLERAQQHPERFTIIDASKALEEVQGSIERALAGKLRMFL